MSACACVCVCARLFRVCAFQFTTRQSLKWNGTGSLRLNTYTRTDRDADYAVCAETSERITRDRKSGTRESQTTVVGVTHVCVCVSSTQVRVRCVCMCLCVSV